MLNRSLAVVLTVCLLWPEVSPTQPRPSPRLELTVDTIMRGPALYGWSPQSIRWSGDGQKVFFRWKRYDEPLLKDYSTYVVNRDGSGLRQLTEEEAQQAPPEEGDETRDWKLKVYAEDGDLFLYDQMALRRHRLTRTAEVESNPRFTRDEKRISFMRGNNLYVLSPREGSVEQLTDIRRGSGSSATRGAEAARGGGFLGLDPPPQQETEENDQKGTDSQEFLKKEEKELLSVVRERAEKRAEREAKRKKENPRKPFRLTARQSVNLLLLSPDETYVLAMISESSERSKPTIVPNYITETAYTAEIPSRTKVGDEQAQSKLAILDAQTGEVRWVEASSADPSLKDRSVRYTRPQWNEDGSRLAVLARATDNKDAWIFAVDPKDGKCRKLAEMHDDAWVGGPASFTWGWLPDDRIYYTAEKDNYSHLFTVNVTTGQTAQLTSGAWEVRNVSLSADRTKFYLTTSEVHPGEEHLYELSIAGGERKRLTWMPGAHRAVVSPDGGALATIHSYTNRPWELYLQDLSNPRARARRVTQSPAPEFTTYPWLDVPIVQIPARDGVLVPARMYKPAGFKRGGPLVVFVHGAGYLQNVHRYWSNYAREYLFHHLLMERGYLVLDVDYRGSAGYGRNWRTAIYRHMGGKDLEDQVDAVKWAIREHGVDPKRVGIYGGSYGGFITLMAMFTQPDVFQAGASLRPVTDWAHYNHPYTSNILNLPHKDAEAYRRSSPIYHAEGLKGALLICHGMVDVNVHFQDTVRLVQRLIELRKENWELAIYPAEDHAFLQPTSWADEYKRILKLFETHLRK
ncbi:MAG: S9 family peptidase [Bryobacteraceae bacterium]|nr:S9 family peptidase [Bryobacteraceae bacterium]MDW8376674.1 prolyl oligopeptidase family serine peptidase [Bryobacterales bacterium]